MAKRFIITLEAEAQFDAADLWPDGDGPADPTTDDVISLLRDLDSQPVKIALHLGLPFRLLVDGKDATKDPV